MSIQESSGIIPVPDVARSTSRLSMQQYRERYHNSLNDSETFWLSEAKRLDWIAAPTVAGNWSFAPKVDIRWFEDGELNACWNCVDRHALSTPDRTALIFEPDDPNDPVRRLSYAELKDEVARFANCLRRIGVARGDRVTIYMPMVPEAVIAMLACARIGAVHSVVFGGFSPEALRGRIEDCDSRFVITADGGRRGGKTIPLKANVDAALSGGPAVQAVQAVLVVRVTGGDCAMAEQRDHWLHELGRTVDDDCPCVPMKAEDPLFILYTSGSIGKPKGVVHTTGGYMVWTAATFAYAFDHPRQRPVLLHGRCGLDHGTQLCRLWAARQWRDAADLRRCSQLSGRKPFLANRRET